MQAKLFGLFKVYLGNHDLYLKTCSINGLKPYCEVYKYLEIVLNGLDAFLQKDRK
jgi:hypothetical protein